MKRHALWLLIGCSLFSFFFPSKQLLSAPYYEGKIIKIVVGLGPGGGHDRMARILAKHLPRFIPGRPVITVENMPGASSMLAANYLFNIAKPDGLTIGTFERGIPTAQLVKSEGARYDVRKFSWIGSMAVEASMITVRDDLPYKNYADLLKAKSPIMFGNTGAADVFSQFLYLLKEFHGLNCKLVNYPSYADVQLAMERKEVDGRGYSSNSFRFMGRGARPVIRGRVSEPEIEHLPVDEDLTTSKLGKALMAIRSSPEQIGRPYVAPPNTPSDAMNILRNAFSQVAKDSELQEESKKIMITINYTPADDCMKVLNYIFSQPEDLVSQYSKYLKF